MEVMQSHQSQWQFTKGAFSDMTTLLRLMMDADQLVILGAGVLAAHVTDPHVR